MNNRHNTTSGVIHCTKEVFYEIHKVDTYFHLIISTLQELNQIIA